MSYSRRGESRTAQQDSMLDVGNLIFEMNENIFMIFGFRVIVTYVVALCFMLKGGAEKISVR